MILMQHKFDNDKNRKKKKGNPFGRKRPVYDVVYVEKDDRIRKIIGGHLSKPRFSYAFSVVPLASNEEVVPVVLTKNVDLVILDGDQFDANIQFIKSMIRKYCISTPILFSFVDKRKAETTNLVTNPLDKAMDKYSLFTTISGPSALHSLIKKSLRIKQIAKEIRDKNQKDGNQKDRNGDGH